MEPEPVQPVLRALSVLEALNHKPVSSLAELAGTTKLPKPTVVRLLDTLIHGGYVHRLRLRRGYTLAERVVRLSGGFRHSDEVVEAARPFLSALTAEHKWPVALATLDRDAMLVRISTVQESPFATDANLINRRVPLLVSALGRAYLASCPADERDTIVALLKASSRERDRPARDAHYVRSLVRAIRQQGYATTLPQRGDPAMGIAVPVMAGGRVLAAMTLRYLEAALTERQAVQRYLPSLKAAAQRIAATVKTPGE